MHTTSRRLAAWGVHSYTAMGLPLNILSVWALSQHDATMFFWFNLAAVVVDSTDGVMARAVKVREVLPEFDGRKLDDITDFLTFAFVPSLFILAFDLMPQGFEWVAALPVLASGYGFCQERAKTDQSWVGFPSLWNVAVFYLYVLDATKWFSVAFLVGLVVMVFLPMHYLYPTKTKMWKKFTLGMGALWGLALVPCVANPEAEWVEPIAWASTLYPVYYFIGSLVNHVRIRREGEPEAGY